MALCACAFAQTQTELTEADLTGLWSMEYVSAEGFMVDAQTYGIVVLLTLGEDGVLEIGDEVGSIFFTRSAEDAA